MTETEWFSISHCNDLATAAVPYANSRQFRLFAAACCRHVLHLAQNQRLHYALKAIEKATDRPAPLDQRQLHGIRNSLANVASSPVTPPGMVFRAIQQAAAIDSFAAVRSCLSAAETARCLHAVANRSFEERVNSDLWIRAAADANELHCILFRDIIGNPFRRPSLDPAWLGWRDGTIYRLARQMYYSRNFASMPILADALEEAGCTNGDILDHCRGPGPHVRGCWVVDLIIRKE